MGYILKFVLGDYNGSGHDMQEIHYKESNYSKEEITKAYEKAVSIVGIDLVKDVGDDCDEYCMQENHFKRFLDLGILSLGDLYDTEDFESLYLNSQIFLEIFEAMIKMVLEDFKWSDFQKDYEYLDILEGAGYGFLGMN